MPAVNFNRIYQVRARERQGQLNNMRGAELRLPDAAGAYIKANMLARQGELQAKQGELDATRTQLGIIESNARLEQQRIRDKARKYNGIISGINAFNSTINFMERLDAARERQDADNARHLLNAGKRYLLENEGAIEGAEYGKSASETGEIEISGPLPKAREVCDGFLANADTRKTYEALGEKAKQAFDDAWGMEVQGTLNRAERRQAELRQKHEVEGLTDEVKLATAKASQFHAAADIGDWAAAAQEAAGSAKTLAMYAEGYIDSVGNPKKPIPPEKMAKYEEGVRDVYDKLNFERLTYCANHYAETGDEQYLNELKAWGGETFDGDCILEPSDATAIRDDTLRQKVRGMRANAEAEYAAKLKREDAERLDGAMLQLRNIMAGGDPEQQAAAIDALRGTAFHDVRQSDKLNSEIDTALDQNNTANVFQALGELATGTGADVMARAESLRPMAGRIADGKMRAAAETMIDTLVGNAEFVDWQRDYTDAISAIGNGAFDEEQIAAANDAVIKVQDRIGAMKTDKGKELALAFVTASRSGIQDRMTQRTVDVLTQGWYTDDNGRPHAMSKRDAIETFERFLPFMDREQTDKVAESFAKSKVVLKPEDFEGLGDWLNANDAASLFNWAKVGSKGEMVLADDEEWDEEDGLAMDIQRGWGENLVDRNLAAEIWKAVEMYKRMAQADLLQKKPGDPIPTMCEYLNDYFANAGSTALDNFKAANMAQRVQMAMEAFGVANATLFNGPFAEPEQ